MQLNTSQKGASGQYCPPPMFTSHKQALEPSSDYALRALGSGRWGDSGRSQSDYHDGSFTKKGCLGLTTMMGALPREDTLVQAVTRMLTCQSPRTSWPIYIRTSAPAHHQAKPVISCFGAEPGM